MIFTIYLKFVYGGYKLTEELDGLNHERCVMNIKDIFGNTIMRLDELKDKSQHVGALNDALLRNVDFRSFNMEGCLLVGAYCSGGNFQGTNMYWAGLEETDLSFCDLSNAEIRGANAYRTFFYGANLSGTNFSYDNLGGTTRFVECVFSEIIWNEKTNFTGARYDKHTIFPKGFDPVKMGMVLEEEENIDQQRHLVFFNQTVDMREEDMQHTLHVIHSRLRPFDFSLRWQYLNDFSFSDLSGCNFAGGCLMRIIFFHSNLSGCNFSNSGSSRFQIPTAFFKVDLREMIIDSNTNFSGSIYDEKTLFPNDFSPEAFGMRKVNAEEIAHYFHDRNKIDAEEEN